MWVVIGQEACFYNFKKTGLEIFPASRLNFVLLEHWSVLIQGLVQN